MLDDCVAHRALHHSSMCFTFVVGERQFDADQVFEPACTARCSRRLPVQAVTPTVVNIAMAIKHRVFSMRLSRRCAGAARNGSASVSIVSEIFDIRIDAVRRRFQSSEIA
jgi:hypothetical protein